MTSQSTTGGPSWSDFYRLFASVEALQQTVDTQAKKIQAMEATIHGLRDQHRVEPPVATLSTGPLVPAPSEIGAPVTVNPNLPTPPGASRFHEPPLLGGGTCHTLPSDVAVFLERMQTAIFLSRAHLPTSLDKAHYFSSYLIGWALPWWIRTKKDSPHLLDDFDALLDDFKSYYPPSRTNGSVADYATRVRQLVADGVHVGNLGHYPLDAFRGGLNEDVQKALLELERHEGWASTLNKLTEYAILAEKNIRASQ